MAAGNPTLPTLTESDANSKSGTLDSRVGFKYRTHGASKTTSPKGTTEGTTFEDQMHAVLEKLIGGQVVKTATGGLYCGVYKCWYRIGGTDYTFPGETAFLLTASSDNYLYLDASATLKNNVGSWPAGDIFRVAKVTTDVSQITAIEPSVLRNLQIGVVNNWDDILPDNDVDMNGYGFKSLTKLAGDDWTELTISAGSITPTQLFHKVDTEADAASDDLTNITAVAGADNRRLLILRLENSARHVSLKGTGNIEFDGDTLDLTTAADIVILVQSTDTTWSVLASTLTPQRLSQNLDAQNFDLWRLAILALGGDGAIETQTIASGSITPTATFVRVRTEGAAASDDLDNIVATYNDGQVLFLFNDQLSESVTVKNTGVGGYPIKTANGKDCLLPSLLSGDRGVWRVLGLIWDGASWLEIFRSRPELSIFEGGAEYIPTAGPGACHYPGALSLNQKTFQAIITEAFTLKNASGYVVTAPSGGSCVVDIQKNGASIFAADVNRINIQDGTNSDTSDTVDVAFAQGDRLTVEIVTGPNTAASLTVSFNGRSAVKAP